MATIGGILNSLQSFIGQSPKECAKVIPQIIDFAITTEAVFDLTQMKQQGYVSGIQTVFIDNGANTVPISVTTSVIDQTISIGAGWQGFFPVFLTDNIKLTFTSPGSSSIVKICLLNIAIAAATWPSSAEPATGFPPGILPVHDAGLQTFLSPLITGTIAVNTAGVIVAGGTAQNALAANPNRKKWRLENTDMAINEVFYVRDDGTAASTSGGSFILAAGGTGYPGGFIEGTSTGVISVLAATTGHVFTISQENF